MSRYCSESHSVGHARAERTCSIFPPVAHCPATSSKAHHQTLDVEVLSKAQLDETLDGANLLPLAWAVVLANRTNTDECLFAIVRPGDPAIRSFHFTLQPDHTAGHALSALSALSGNPAQGPSAGNQDLESSECPMHKQRASVDCRTLMVIGTAENANRPPIADSRQDRYALILRSRLDSGAIWVHATFDPCCLTSAELELMLIDLADTVRAVVTRPEDSIDDIRCVGERGLRHLRQWAESPKGGDDGTAPPVLNQIQQQCQDHPDAPAIDAWDGCLTYGELDRATRCIAGHLSQAGVRPGQFVGLLMPKSVQTTIGMLAVARVGAGFMLLPPSLPLDRLRTMCQWAPVTLILTTEDYRPMSTELEVSDIQTLSDLMPTAGQPASMADTFPARPDHPLYAVFTSGSTGKPKGIVVTRQDFGAGIREFGRRTQLGPGSRVFQFASYAFVVSISEQLMALALGACVCVPSDQQLQNEMDAAIRDCRATWMITTPSVARTLNAGRLPSLRTMLLAGEPVTLADATAWQGGPLLYSDYGQAETASTFLLRSLDPSAPWRPGDLGQATVGRCWVVHPDDHQRLQPLGMEGELLLESTALAREYMHDPDNTRATFIQRPRWRIGVGVPISHPTTRWLLTGDLVRYASINGSLQLVGRKGTRTKIRGQRVELTEIEGQLRALLPEMQDLVVELVNLVSSAGHGSSTPSLLAFSVTKNEPAGASVQGTSDWMVSCTPGHRKRAHHALETLRGKLPEYMIPQAILPLRDLPRTTTGKIYRKGLREWASKLRREDILDSRSDPANVHGPQTGRERVLQAVCAAVLDVPPPKIALNDHFFHLGGDSLTARQLVHDAEVQGLQFTVSEVFQQPTLRQLAEHSRWAVPQPKAQDEPSHGTAQSNEDAFAAVKSLLQQEAGDFEDAYPMLDVQKLVLQPGAVCHLHLEITGPLDVARLQRSCQLLVDRNSALRSVFIERQGQALQVVQPPGSVAWSGLAIPEGQDPSTWVQSWCMQEQKRRCHPLGELAVQFTLIQAASTRHILVMRLANAQFDGASLPLITQQLAELYSHDASLPACPPDFSHYRREGSQSRTPEALYFWRNLIHGVDMTRLPCLDARQRPGLTIYLAECVPAPPPAGITLATAIKAAWASVLATVVGQQDVLFGQILNTRSVATQQTIGMCLSTNPVRVTVKPDERVRDLLRKIQEQHVQALPFETVDWSDLFASGSGPELDSVVLHENIDPGQERTLDPERQTLLRLGAHPLYTCPVPRRHSLLTWPSSSGLMTTLQTPTGILDPSLGQRLVARFNQTLVRFLADPDATVVPRDQDCMQDLGVHDIAIQELNDMASERMVIAVG